VTGPRPGSQQNCKRFDIGVQGRLHIPSMALQREVCRTIQIIGLVSHCGTSGRVDRSSGGSLGGGFRPAWPSTYLIGASRHLTVGLATI
jgi:hypothetical protein